MNKNLLIAGIFGFLVSARYQLSNFGIKTYQIEEVKENNDLEDFSYNIS